MPSPLIPFDADLSIPRVGQLMLARGMTDVAGGNISVRDGEHVLMTPRYAGHSLHWDVAPYDLMRFDMAGRPVSGEREPSRDLQVHLGVYAAAPEAGAVIHAHAPHCLVFATAGIPIPPAIAAADVIGAVPVVPGQDEAAEVAAFAGASRDRIGAFAAAVLIARHGIVVIGRDLAHAYDALERVEACARTILLARLLSPRLPDPPSVDPLSIDPLSIESPTAVPHPVNGSAPAAV